MTPQKLNGYGPLRSLGRRIAQCNDQLKEGGPRLRGVGTAASAPSMGGSELRSAAARRSERKVEGMAESGGNDLRKGGAQRAIALRNARPSRFEHQAREGRKSG